MISPLYSSSIKGLTGAESFASIQQQRPTLSYDEEEIHFLKMLGFTDGVYISRQPVNLIPSIVALYLDSFVFFDNILLDILLTTSYFISP